MTGIDIVIEVWKKLNVPTVTTLLGAGKVWQHNRPVNSKNPDVVISLPVFDGNSRALNYVDVNIHTPNLKEYRPFNEDEDHTFPDLAKHKSILDTVLPLLTSGAGYSIRPAILGVPIRDVDGQWFTNIRCTIITLDNQASIMSKLRKVVSMADGYAGVTTTLQDVWEGLAERLSIPDESQVTTESGRLDLTRRERWRIPAVAGKAPQKSHVFSNSQGTYNILAIYPNGESFWDLMVERKDGAN